MGWGVSGEWMDDGVVGRSLVVLGRSVNQGR